MYGSPRSLFRVPKISNRQRRHIADLAIVQAQKVHVILLAVLAQKGDVTITDGTLKQIEQNFDKLDYVIEAGQNAGEHVVKLISGKNDAEEVDSGERDDEAANINAFNAAAQEQQRVGEDVI